MRWAEDYHLFFLGPLSFGTVSLGRMAIRRRWRNWIRLHITCMGLSYILLLTAFYVDNGKNLPLWNKLPPIAFCLLPGAIGSPFIVRALLRQPLVLRSKGATWQPADKSSGRRAETRG
jgi:hypothetical protein